MLASCPKPVTQDRLHRSLFLEGWRHLCYDVSVVDAAHPGWNGGAAARRGKGMDNRGCVLVVEDDDGVRELICSVLADEGYRSLGAENGQGALALIERYQPQVILADVRMPVMDGCEFARACREQLGATPIVALTGAEDLSDLSDPALFDAVLNKPFNLMDLLEIVERHTAGEVPQGIARPQEQPKHAASVGER